MDIGREMAEVVLEILEEYYDENGLSIDAIQIDMQEVILSLDVDVDDESVLSFAFDLSSNHRCCVEIESVNDENEEEPQVIVLVNQKWENRDTIRVIIK